MLKIIIGLPGKIGRTPPPPPLKNSHCEKQKRIEHIRADTRTHASVVFPLMCDVLNSTNVRTNTNVIAIPSFETIFAYTFRTHEYWRVKSGRRREKIRRKKRIERKKVFFFRFENPSIHRNLTKEPNHPIWKYKKWVHSPFVETRYEFERERIISFFFE